MASTLPLDATSTLHYLPFLPNWARHDGAADGDDGGDAGTDDGDGDDGGDGEPVVDPPAKTTPKAPAKKPVAKPTDDGDGEPAGLGDNGKRALTAERERRRAASAEAAQAKADLEAANARIQAFEDEKRTDLEKAQAAAEKALAREKAANLRAVTSDLRSYAITADALDPSEVVDLLSKDAEKFLTDSGVDSDAIEKAVTELLEKKPHWRKPEPPAAGDGDPAPKVRAKAAPQPDPGQGSKGSNTTPDWSDPKTFEAEARRLGLPTYR